MADFDWPETLAPHTVSFYLSHSSRVHESPYTRQRQILGLAPPRWVCRMSLGGGAEDWLRLDNRGARLDALLAQLRGPQRSVAIYDFRRPLGRGDTQSFDDYAAGIASTGFTDGTDFTDGTEFNVAVTGSGPPTNSPAAIGTQVVTCTGFAPNRLVRGAGDYIGFGHGRPYLVTADAFSDATGSTVITFEPPARTAIGAGVLELARVRATFRLVSDDAGNNPTGLSGWAGFELDFVEDLT